MSRNRCQDPAQQANQINVIQIDGLLEQKDIRESQGKQDRGNPVQETAADRRRQTDEHREMEIKSDTRPRMDPAKTVVFEQQRWFEECRRDPALLQKPEAIQAGHQTEEDPKCDQRVNRNGIEQPGPARREGRPRMN